ncbi:MAG: hypothetical protein JNK04_05545, partial [Myxococcales bacterium]|nr:hypothetical protein [Myxococcales bacterium]
MTNPIDPVEVLAERVSQALEKAFGPELRDADPMIRRSDHADYQSNVALSLKKRVPGSPRDTAAKIVAALDLEGIAELPVE